MKKILWIIAAAILCVVSDEIRNFSDNAQAFLSHSATDSLSVRDSQAADDTNLESLYAGAWIRQNSNGISAQSTNTLTNIPRQNSFAKKSSSHRNFSVCGYGKIETASVLNFNSFLNLFPSGLSSHSHSFIRMCKLNI